jgi:hypothetical protein
MLTHVRRAMFGVLVLAAASMAQAQTLETFAGGRTVDNLPSLEAPVTTGAMLTTVDGTVYVVDTMRNRLMRRDPATSMLTLFPSSTVVAPWNAVYNVFRSASGNSYLYAGGALYQLFLPTGQIQLITRLDNGNTACNAGEYNAQFAADWNGNIYFVDSGRNSVCKVLGLNSIQRIAGADTAGFAGDGGPATSARFNSPFGIAIDFENNILVADTGNNRIRKINVATGIITTYAGNGTAAYGGENVIAANASLAAPTYLATDSNNHLFITEIGVTRVRRLNPFTGRLNTFAGDGQQLFDSPDGGLATQTALAWPTNFAAFPNQGDYLISDLNDSRTRRVSASTGIISTFIGNGSWYFCGESSLPRDACLDDPMGVSVDANGDVYIADTRNRRIRRYSVETGLLTTIAGRDGPNQFQGESGLALAANFGADLGGLTLDAAGNIFVAGAFAERITRIDKATGIITTIGGSGLRGFAGDGGLATAARTNYPSSVAVDGTGNIYFSDKNNHRVRKIAAGTGIITTVAGNGLATGPLGDNGPATSASLAYPHKVGFDNAGNLLIADTQHFRVRKVNKITGVITTIIGNGSSSNSGDGGSATNAGLNGVDSFVVDPVGNILVVSGSRLRRVDATNGTINQIPNVPMQSPEGLWITGPGDLALDASGRLYIAALDAVMRVSGIPPVAGDSTPPVIIPTTSGPLGTNGWWRGGGKVTVQLSAFDNESLITSHSGCGFVNEVNSDTPGTTFTCTATSAGGTSTLSVTVRRDSVAPTLTFGSASPAADSSGWNSTDVSVPFVAVDALSGVFTTSSGSPVIVIGEGAGLTRQVTVTDTAGNSATFTTPAFNIDRTAPMVTPNVSGTLGTNGWYTSNVEVSWSVADTSSTVTATTGCDAAAVTTDTTGITYTCTATSAGGSTTQSVTIKRDATAPQLEFGAPSPAANSAGWHGGDVSIPFTATDATSGIASTSSPNPVLISGVGANRSVDVVVKDNAGNAATFPSPAVNIDRSAPVVTPDVSGTLGSNGWYTSNIQVAWTTSDDNAPIDTAEGCETSLVAADTAGVTFTCTASSAGGLATQSITIRRDATPPQLVFGPPSPAANASGWHNGDVTFTFDITDATSGIASTSANSPLLIAGDGTGLSQQVVVTDAAGNSAHFTTPPVNIDRVPPSIQPVVNGAIGNGGWFRSDVQVSWVIDESPASIISTNGCDASVVNTDTAGVTLTCSVASGGGTASSSVTIRRDATPPVLNFGTPSPAPNSNGWNKTNVSIPFTRSDALSGLASTSTTSPLVFNTEGANLTAQVVVTDVAGNSATFTSVPRNIDKTAPVAEMNTPEDHGTYGFYQDVVADFWCTDTLLVSCTAPTANGALINTRTAGALSYKITAKDSVYTTTHAHAYNVESWLNFDGFLAPASSAPTLNLVTRGALVPIRWRLPDGRGGYVTNPASFTSATVGSLTCGNTAAVPLNDVASGPAGISFDAATNSFVYNWQTSTSWTGCRKLTIKLKDNSVHELRFRFQ